MDVAKLEKAIDNDKLTLDELRFLHYFFDQLKVYRIGLEDMLKYSDDKETPIIKVPNLSLRDHFLLSSSIREKLNNQEGES